MERGSGIKARIKRGTLLFRYAGRMCDRGFPLIRNSFKEDNSEGMFSSLLFSTLRTSRFGSASKILTGSALSLLNDKSRILY